MVMARMPDCRIGEATDITVAVAMMRGRIRNVTIRRLFKITQSGADQRIQSTLKEGRLERVRHGVYRAPQSEYERIGIMRADAKSLSLAVLMDGMRSARMRETPTDHEEPRRHIRAKPPVSIVCSPSCTDHRWCVTRSRRVSRLR